MMNLKRRLRPTRGLGPMGKQKRVGGKKRGWRSGDKWGKRKKQESVQEATRNL